MKKYIIMAILAMAVAVQGYAQPRPRYHHHPHHVPVMPSWYLWSAVHGYYYYSALHCYWWGPSWDYPTKIKIDCLELKRTASGRLRIKNGDLPKAYYSMWENNSWRFRCPSGIVADVTTGDGQTKVKVYSKDGKITSTHTLTTRSRSYYDYYY